MADSDLGSAGGMAARVLRTGLAVVHEGELVLPAAGSEAEAELVSDDARSVIHYYFPVEIEVRSAGEAIDRHEVMSATLNALTQAVESL